MLSSEVPQGYHFDFQEYLFSAERHRLTQAKEGWKSFYWLDEKKKHIQASFHVHFDGNTAQSPFRATFGGIDFSSKLSQRHLTEFIRGFETVLIDWKIKEIKIIICPQIYHSNKFSQQFQALVDNGFKLFVSDLTSTIQIGTDSFKSIISNSARVNLKKAVNLVFRHEGASSFSKIYDVLKECREERGYQLSMTKSQLLLVTEELHEDLELFGVYNYEKLIAGAIVLKVSDKILYAFYAGHLKEFDGNSPTVFLYSEIYKYCQQNNFELLDLGSSAENGFTKFGLLEFKESIGAVPSLKPTFFKQLND